VFLVLYAWPFLERRVTGDYGVHNLLDRPRDAPWRTALGLALFTWVALVFFAGSADRVSVLFGLSYTAQIWAYRILLLVLPLVVMLVARRVCLELQQGEVVERERRYAEAQARAAGS
jgi:ubiquinol-cytochrome c reductase cytochrome b subunit